MCLKCTMKATTNQIKKVKDWIISEIESSMGCYTYPEINKATEKNIEKAIEQNEDTTTGELEALKEMQKIFKIIKNW